MFSTTEAKQIRQEFWTTFGKQYPRRWLLYNTKIKNVTLKFTFTTKKAQVSIDIEPNDSLLREYYFDKFLSLQSILTTEYLEHIVYDAHYELDNGKFIPRLYVEKLQVSIHNRTTWEETMQFLSDQMELLEDFFVTYKDYIKDK